MKTGKEHGASIECMIDYGSIEESSAICLFVVKLLITNIPKS